MIRLNLPPYDYKIKKSGGKLWIFDGIRKKYVALLPEEWVRQHFIQYLISSCKYHKALIKVEGGLRYHALQKRTDIVVYTRDGKPWMVVECKAPDVSLDTRSAFQASVYNSTLQAEYLVITNGLSHYVAKIDWAERRSTILENLPDYQ